ncbi:MAG: iron-containing alcohol dehydrogenase [Verrucomicrobiia bacterium]
MQFEFATATRIIFGKRVSVTSIQNIITLIEGRKGKVLVLTGKEWSRSKFLIDLLNQNGIETILFQVEGEPTIELVKSAAQIARENSVCLVIGIGGGSVIDCGKAVSAMATNPGSLLDYLEVIGLAKPLAIMPLPFVAIPTTSGTGAEVTKNAVITSKKEGVKASLRHPFLLPKLAIIDPELTLTTPPRLTAETGLDALTQLIEAFISVKANPLTDALAVEGIRRAGCSLRQAFFNGNDISAREDMAIASLFSGIALANAGLGAVHGFAAPIGGIYSAPHGAVCAALIAPVLKINLQALRQRENDSPTLEKFKTIARLLTSNPNAKPDEAVEWIEQTCSMFGLRKLRDFGMKRADFSELIIKAQKASSMKGNPVKLTERELELILEGAF